MRQHLHAVALGALVLVCATSLWVSLLGIHSSVRDLARSLHTLPQKIEIARMQNYVCITKTTELGPVTFYCYQMPGETPEDFGKRCRAELVAFCKGFES